MRLRLSFSLDVDGYLRKYMITNLGNKMILILSYLLEMTLLWPLPVRISVCNCVFISSYRPDLLFEQLNSRFSYCD